MANINRGTHRHVFGAWELSDALRRLSLAVQTEVVRAGVTAAVEPVLAAEVSYCPIRTDSVGARGKKLRPGEMKASIRAKVVSYPTAGKAVGLVGPTGRAKRVAHLVEFGHLVVVGASIKRGGKEAGNGTTHVPPKPFIRPAVLSTLSQQAAGFVAGASAAYVKAVKEL